MSIASVITRGFGHSAALVVTRGFEIGAAVPEVPSVRLGNLGFGRVSRRARRWERERYRRWQETQADENEIGRTLAKEYGLVARHVAAPAEAIRETIRETAEEVAAIVEPYREIVEPYGKEARIDWAALAADADRLGEILAGLARINAQIEIEIEAEEDAVLLLLLAD